MPPSAAVARDGPGIEAAKGRVEVGRGGGGGILLSDAARGGAAQHTGEREFFAKSYKIAQLGKDIFSSSAT